jgi:ribosome-associated protein
MTRDTDDNGKSRSQKKRESAAAQSIGAALATLPEGDLETLGLPPSLFEAILDWRKFPGHEAKRRQMQYIGRLMRGLDIAAMEEKLEARLAPGLDEAKAPHAAEAMRDRLANAEGKALEEELAGLAARYPGAPVARLRHLSETARNERERKKPPKARRELFRLLRDMAARTDG